jgi:hypothetical protein
VAALEQALHDSATLFARASRDDDMTYLLSLATYEGGFQFVGVDVLALIR